MQSTRSTILLATFTALTLAVSMRAASAATTLRDAHGIRVDSVTRLDDRQLDVRVSTDALQRPVDLRILLPDDYDGARARHYPVLYLFHGTSGRASDWVEAGNVVATTAGLPLIVVMPDAGFDGDGGGWFTNWFNGGAFGPPMWETFHVDQVIPWIDANLRTIAQRRGRAIAGLSQGGFGALTYAARHPDLFTSVAAFSGGCVIDRDPLAIQYATFIIQFTTTELSGIADPDAIFGPRATQELNWQAHDPGTLVTNLRGMHIELWTGDGTPGVFDPTGIGTDPIEVITFTATQLLDGYLKEAGIRHGYHYYGGGTHSWPYWARDLAEYVGPLMRRFRAGATRPNSISYLTTAGDWDQWSWQVVLAREEAAFSQLRRARRQGFILDGTGRAKIRTPRFYRPGARMSIESRGPAGRSSRPATVDRNGRLRIALSLGNGPTPGSTRVRVTPAP